MLLQTADQISVRVIAVRRVRVLLQTAGRLVRARHGNTRQTQLPDHTRGDQHGQTQQKADVSAASALVPDSIFNKTDDRALHVLTSFNESTSVCQAARSAAPPGRQSGSCRCSRPRNCGCRWTSPDGPPSRTAFRPAPDRGR